jgi:hypothetical protein
MEVSDVESEASRWAKIVLSVVQGLAGWQLQ